MLGADPKEEIRLTVVVAPEIELPGDLQVTDVDKDGKLNTEHNAVYATTEGANLHYAATLNVGQVFVQMLDNEQLQTNLAEQRGKTEEEFRAQFGNIRLTGLDCSFTVLLDVPDEIQVDLDSFALADANNNGKFTVEDVSKTGRQIQITIVYDKDGTVTNYADLAYDVLNISELLQLDFEAKVADDALHGSSFLPQTLTIKGTLNGDFFSNATLNSTTIPFAFSWHSAQDTDVPAGNAGNDTGDGTDKILENASDRERQQIWVTIVIAPQQTLMGDLQVRDTEGDAELDTERTAAHKTYEGAVLDYAAVLNVRSIFAQMLQNEEAQFEKPQANAVHPEAIHVVNRAAGGSGEIDPRFSRILLSGLQSSFVVKLTADPDLDMSEATYELINENKGKFTIDKVERSGQNITITMVYDQDHEITNYAELADDIQNHVDDLLHLNIANVKVSDDVSERYLTIRGTVEGSFYAMATSGSTSIPFAYRWSGVQDDDVPAGNYGNDTGDGLDWIIAEGVEDGAKAEKTDIWVTVEVFTKVDVTKVWDDGDDEDGIRPSSVTVNLLSDGKKTDSANVTEKSGWEHTFDELPKFNDQDEKIVYTVTEDTVKDYTTEITGSAAAGFTITNKHVPTHKPTPKPTATPTRKPTATPQPYNFKFTFTKEWVGTPGSSITWTLYNADGKPVSKKFNKKVVSSKEWRYEAWFETEQDLYLIENVPEGYTVLYKNVGKHAGETDRCYNGGTIVNNQIPKTGDSAAPAWWILACLLGSIGLCLSLRKRKQAKR